MKTPLPDLPLRDRADAGRRLAARLLPYRTLHPLVLGLPRGGIIPAFEIARALTAPLDVFVARKVGAPFHPEYGIGAVAPGVTISDPEALRGLGISASTFEELAREARVEMLRRLRLYRGTEAPPRVTGRTVILVDDGLATGYTALAAIRSLRLQHPHQLVLAVGVCARDTAATIRPEVDDLVSLAAPDPFHAVGLWYRAFGQTTDAEVLALLRRAREDAGLREAVGMP